jgi:hypothetical protein
MRVLFCTSDQIGARLIRAVTWSDWSHVAIIDGAEVIEAVWPAVRVRPLADVLATHPRHAIVDFHCPRDDLAIAWARAQVGKPYDLAGMLGLGLHRDWQDDSKWWCSEITLGAANQGGFTPFRAETLHRITPQHLWMLSPPGVATLPTPTTA